MAERAHPGRKDDAGKAQLRLLPWEALAEVAAVLEYGVKKYSEGNWKQVPDGRNRYLDAALRHLGALAAGQELDPESGLHHAAHAACSVLFLLHFVKVRASRG